MIYDTIYNMIYDMIYDIIYDMILFHQHVWGGGALSKNADNADAWEGGWWCWGDSDKMLTLLTLGSAGVKMLGLNK